MNEGKRSGGMMEREIHSESVQVERKIFSFTLKENPRGRYLRITEDVSGRKDTVIIPSTGLDRIRECLDKIIEADKNAGPVKIAPGAQGEG